MQSSRNVAFRLTSLSRTLRTPARHASTANALNSTNDHTIHVPPVTAVDQQVTPTNVEVQHEDPSASVGADSAADQPVKPSDSSEQEPEAAPVKFHFPSWSPPSEVGIINDMCAALTGRATPFAQRHEVEPPVFRPAESKVPPVPANEEETNGGETEKNKRRETDPAGLERLMTSLNILASRTAAETEKTLGKREKERQRRLEAEEDRGTTAQVLQRLVSRITAKEPAGKKSKKKRRRELAKEALRRAKLTETDPLGDPFLAEAVAMAREAARLERGESEAAEQEESEAAEQKELKAAEQKELGVPSYGLKRKATSMSAPQSISIYPKADEAGVVSTESQSSTSLKSKRGIHGTYVDRDIFYTAFKQRSPPDHVHNGRPPLPLSYTRRVEGFLEANDGDIPIQDLDPPSEHRPIARLAHGLDRVLFNPGVHWLQDPRSHVFNFAPWLQTVPKVKDFDFERVRGFIKSSEDNDLHTLAKKEGCLLTGSTSSLTGMLSHIYMMLSREKLVDTSSLSAAFHKELRNFTPGQKLPVSVVLRYDDGVYSTDSNPADPGQSEKNVLTWMGTMLEKFLTVPEDEFSRLLRDAPPLEQTDDGKREAYRYARFGNYVMRSQLDCRDPRLPGTGVFDIKTRAALPIRLDLMNWEENSGYLIRRLQGRLESFEREYYDLIRSAFLKYSFQARIGNMDGVFVTYHNTARIFGFQYIPLEEMDERLYGNPAAGLPIFKRCLRLLEIINTEITQHFPGQSISTVWDSYPEKSMLRVWAEPVSDETDDKDRPCIELEIHTINYHEQQAVKGWAIPESLPDANWTVHYKIFTSSMHPNVVRARRQTVLDEQQSYWSLPSGVSPDEVDAYWRSIDYGGKASRSPHAPLRSDAFKTPDKSVKMLRKLARQGKIDSERLAQEHAGRRQIVWGQPDVLIDESAEDGDEERAAAGDDVDGLLLDGGSKVKTVGEVDDADVVKFTAQPAASDDADVTVAREVLMDAVRDQPAPAKEDTV